MSDRQPPTGFAPLEMGSEFVKLAGPMLGRRSDDGIDIGFFVEERHCNIWNNCHGGWMSTFADVQLAIACKMWLDGQAAPAKQPLLATISLTVDFLAPAPLGSWVEGSAQVLRSGSRTAFSQMTASADGTLCMRASGIFKL